MGALALVLLLVCANGEPGAGAQSRRQDLRFARLGAGWSGLRQLLRRV
jgi:hypothetical protein